MLLVADENLVRPCEEQLSDASWLDLSVDLLSVCGIVAVHMSDTEIKKWTKAH